MADVTTDGGTPASWQQTSDYTPGSAPTDERATIAYRGSQETAQAPRRRREWPKVPGYELLEVLGQGAMGVVYKARHEGLKRLVALKMILSGAHAGETELARFRTEAEAVARLTHPHIVQVHDFGEWRPESGGSPLPYLALEYVSGGTLSKYLKGTPQSPRFAAELLRHLAEAIQYAHEHNVIHRDLKPGNILLEGTSHESVSGGTVSQATPLHGGTMKGPAMQAREQLFLIPKIADFGLAKQLDEQSFQTMSGAIMGTPSYMAPEQASGHASQIGPSADVYALGSILYEVLTGRPPFKGVSMFETIEQVRNQEPVPPSRLQPRIPADLETICLKCLQKDAGRRYASAKKLAEDLGRFLRDEPIHARPVSRLERGWRWCRRNPFPAALITAIGLVMVVGSVVSTHFGFRAMQGEADAKEQTKIAQEQTKVAEAQTKIAKEQEKIAREKTKLAEEKTLEAQRKHYNAEFGGALNAWEKGRIVEVQQKLKDLEPKNADDPDLRSFEWHWLRRQCRLELRTLLGHERTVYEVAISPDGRLLASAGHEGTIRVWDRPTGREIHALKGHERVRVSGVVDDEGYRAAVYSVAFSPDGKTLASGAEDMTIRLWDIATGKELAKLVGHTQAILRVVFSPDGKTLVAAGNRGELVRWDLATGSGVMLTDQSTAGNALVQSPDGTRLYAAGTAMDILVWDAITWAPLPPLKGHSGTVNKLALSLDGKRLASYGQDQLVRIWDTASGTEIKRLEIERQKLECLALSPDGERLATGGSHNDHMVRVWAVATGKEVLTLRGHGMNVSSIVFTPDGWQLVSTSSGEVKVWDAEVVPERVFVQAHTSPASGLAIGPNDRWLATCSHSGEIHVWDPELGFRLKTLPGHVGGTRALCIHPTSGQLISVGEDGRIRLWDVDGDAKAEVLQEFGKQLRACACSRDGKWLAANGQGSVLLLDLTNRQLVRQFPSSLAMGAERYLAFHPTESWLCIANEEEYPLLRHLETGEVVKEWRVGEKGSGAVAISPDGLLCANGDYLRIWNLQREEPPLELHKNQYFQMGALFSPDGRRVAAGGVERIVRVWDSFTGAELLALLGHRNRVRGVAMSSDGLMLASVGEDGYLQIWDARPLTPERRDQREAASLVQFLKKRLVSQAELPERIRQHPGICDNVRSIALRLAEAR